MKNGRYFNFRDICNRNLWDTEYLFEKLQGYRDIKTPPPPPPPPNGASTLLPSLDLMMSSGKLCFRKPNKTLGLMNFFSAKNAPNSKRVRCAVYKRFRENGASWAKQLQESISGSLGGGGGGERKIAFVLKMTAGDPCIVHP